MRQGSQSGSVSPPVLSVCLSVGLSQSVQSILFGLSACLVYVSQSVEGTLLN